MRRLKLGTISLISVLVVSIGGQVHADAFYANKIIDDAVFDNAGSMSAAQIDSFLNNFSGSCISTNRGFAAVDPIGYNPTNGYQYGGYVSAGQVIYDAAQAYSLNPQVIITTLEKEQSLVTGKGNYNGYCNNGDQHKYAAAVGYGCPDSGTIHSYTGLSLYRRNGVVVSDTGTTCVGSASQAGFSQQVIRAAWLFKFGEQRSQGRVSWAVIKGNWNNSDDPQTCYGGPMMQGTYARCPSGAATYYDGYTTIDATSVHVESGGTAALYWYTPHFHGNQNFFSLFTAWFGSTYSPYAFKSPTSATVYLYVSGYKLAVPYMGMLQDYGISPESIQTVSQSYLDNIPSGDSGQGISSTLSSIIKSPSDADGDGGSIYFISAGKRYQIASMTQFADFGFSEANISYLPLSYLQNLPNGGVLSNFVKSPDGAVFKVASGTKRLILDNNSYKSLNPSDAVSYLSYFGVNSVASATPIGGTATQIKFTNSSTVFVYVNGRYYQVPYFDTYNCWGLSSSNISSYTVQQSSYITAPVSSGNLGCFVKTGSTLYLMNDTSKIAVPGSYGLGSSVAENADINAISALVPTNANSLNSYIKSATGSAVWFIEGGVMKVIPTYNDYQLLKVNNASLSVLSPATLSSFTFSGIKLGAGSLVKTDNSSTVYVINGNSRVAYDSSEIFIAHNNSWDSIRSYPATTLDSSYPATGTRMGRYLYDATTQTGYLADSNGCFSLASSLLGAYGLSQAGLSADSTTQLAVSPAFVPQACAIGAVYVKQSNQSLVYKLVNGTKSPVLTYAKLQSDSGQTNPYVITISNSAMESFATGSPL